MDYKEKLIVLLNNTELSEEQKAKLEEIFPGLCESENDRIKKFIENELVCLRACYDEGTERHEQLSNAIAWLEKQSEQKSAWSEKYIADVFENVGLAKIIREQENDSLTRALQSAMIELAKYSVVPQIRQEWSKEDESHIRYLIECLEHCKKGVALTMSTSTSQEYINWLKSLRPQSQWKPSEEQIKVLEFFIPYVTKCSIVLEKSKGTLLSLLSDLKKLKG